MQYYHLTLAGRGRRPLPLCRTPDGYRAVPDGVPADVPVYRMAAALREALTATPDLTDVCLTELPSTPGPPPDAQHDEVVLDWDSNAPVPCRCGARALLRETVTWSQAGVPMQRVYAWCSSCFAAAYAAEEAVPAAPPAPPTTTLDGWSIIHDWFAHTHEETPHAPTIPQS